MAALDVDTEARYNDAVAFVGTLKNMPSGACHRNELATTRRTNSRSLGFIEAKSLHQDF